MKSLTVYTMVLVAGMSTSAMALECGKHHSVVGGDTLSGLSLKSYGSFLYQPIYNANLDVIGSNPDIIHIGQNLLIPCLSADGSVAAGDTHAKVEGQLVFTFNKASAPPFVINSGIIDGYLTEITEVTQGRVTFVDPKNVNRDHAQQFDLVTSGQVDGAYVLNAHLAQSHPLLQLPMQPTFGGSAEQTAVALWQLHEDFLADTDYFTEARLLGFVAAPAAHIWRDKSMPITSTEGIASANEYHVPYFHGLDTRGPAVMRAEVADWNAAYAAQHNEVPTFFLAHGAAIALGIWDENSSVSVMEVDNGLYTPTFSVVLSNEAWAQISPEDQKAIEAVSGRALAHRSSAWDDFDNNFRSRMLDLGLEFEKADVALLEDLFRSSFDGLAKWMQAAGDRDIPTNDAINAYLTTLRSLEDRLIYRAQDGSLDQHPFVTGGF